MLNEFKINGKYKCKDFVEWIDEWEGGDANAVPPSICEPFTVINLDNIGDVCTIRLHDGTQVEFMLLQQEAPYFEEVFITSSKGTKPRAGLLRLEVDVSYDNYKDVIEQIKKHFE